MKIKINHIMFVLLIAIFIQFSYTSLTRPIVFGDEGFYAGTAEWISQNHIYPAIKPLLSNDIYNNWLINKPLFIYFETFAFYIGEYAVKLVSPIISLLGAFLIYILGKEFKQEKIGMIGAFVYLMTPSLITYALLGYVDALFVTLNLLTIIFAHRAYKTENNTYKLLTGIFIALSFLTKPSAPFLVLYLILYSFLFKNPNKWKTLGTILVIALVFFSPQLVKNFAVFGNVCYQFLSFDEEKCGPQVLVDVPDDPELQFEGRTDAASTEVGLLQFGFMNYMSFSYGWAITLLLFIGLGIILSKGSEFNTTIGLLLLSILPLLYLSTWRAEDTARYMLPTVIPIALLVGMAIQNLQKFAKKYNKYLGVLAVILLLAFVWTYGNQKIQTMGIVKNFAPGFIDGCAWVRENTPTDSVVFATYMAQASYQCNRRVSVANDAEEILLSNDERTYEHLKLNGIDYLFIYQGHISQKKLSEFFNVGFINYIESDSHYGVVYDNTAVYGNAGVRIYEVI